MFTKVNQIPSSSLVWKLLETTFFKSLRSPKFHSCAGVFLHTIFGTQSESHDMEFVIMIYAHLIHLDNMPR